MTIFKGYLSIIKKYLPIISFYFFITTSITFGIQMASQDTIAQAFESTRLMVGIVDSDGGSLAKGLSEYLGQAHEVEMLADDEHIIRENLFYQNVDYVIRIPKNFEALTLQENKQLKVTSIPNAYGAFYVEQRIDTFLNGVSVYKAAGYSTADGIDLVLGSGQETVPVQILDMNGNAGRREDYTYMLEYLPYLFIAALCSSLSVVVGVFNNKEIRRKMLSSPISLRRQNTEQVMAFGSLGVVFLCIILLVMAGIYGIPFLQSANLWYFLGNLLCLLLVSLSRAFGVGLMVKKTEAVSNVTTVISLVLCFLGGVFVPLEFLGEDVKRVSRFLPTYWYETNLSILMERNQLTQELQREVFKGYGLQFAFAVACMAVALAFVKYRSQEN